MDKDRRVSERRAPYSFSATLISTIPDPVFYKDCDGRYLGCNPAFENFFGVTQDWLIGKTVFDLQPHFIAEEYRLNDEKLLKHPGESIYEGKVKPCGVKTIREVIIRKATFLDSEGVIGGVVGIVTDITDRVLAERALRDSETRFRRMTENMNDMVVEVDVNGIRTYVSPSHKTIIGMEIEDLLGKHCFTNVHPEDLERVKKTYDESVKGKSHGLVEFRYLLKDGRYVWVESNGSPVLDENGELVGGVIVSRDITCKVQAREARIKAEEDLKILFEAAQETLDELSRLTEEKARKFSSTLQSTVEKMRERRLSRARTASDSGDGD